MANRPCILVYMDILGGSSQLVSIVSNLQVTYLRDLRSPWILITYKSWDDPPSGHKIIQLSCTTWDVPKNLVNNGDKLPFPQLVNAGFLNHQPYWFIYGPFRKPTDLGSFSCHLKTQNAHHESHPMDSSIAKKTHGLLQPLFSKGDDIYPINTHYFWKVYMGVSKNRGTPKWMVYNGKPY